MYVIYKMSAPMPLIQNSKNNRLIEHHSKSNDEEILHRTLRLIHQQPNKLNTVFFSKKNIDAIQNGLRKNVYIKSNKKHKLFKAKGFSESKEDSIYES